MKVVYTDEALENLAGILAYIASRYPTIYGAFQTACGRSSLVSVSGQKAHRKLKGDPACGSSLFRYPYKIFYRRTGEAIEILYIHRVAQDEPRNT
jgi:plasmid stabilization system protein ParE